MRRAVLLAILAASVSGCADGPAPRGPALPDAPGRSLYAAKCTACHRLYDPSSKDAARWPAILDRMAVKAKLTDEEKETVSRYVLSFAR